MKEISESGYSAGWLTNLEYELWGVVEKGSPTDLGRKEIDAALINRLRSLCEQADGWWAWSEEFDGFPVLVPLDAWRAHAEA